MKPSNKAQTRTPTAAELRQAFATIEAVADRGISIYGKSRSLMMELGSAAQLVQICRLPRDYKRIVRHYLSVRECEGYTTMAIYLAARLNRKHSGKCMGRRADGERCNKVLAVRADKESKMWRGFFCGQHIDQVPEFRNKYEDIAELLAHGFGEEHPRS